MIWDLAGRDEFARVKQSYLKGAEGFLFVADGTRRETVDEMREELDSIEPSFPGAVSVVLLNKADLTAEWELEESDIQALEERFPVWVTSALSGDHVEEAFLELTRKMLEGDA
jgi:GTPase SAR1 family protein